MHHHRPLTLSLLVVLLFATACGAPASTKAADGPPHAGPADGPPTRPGRTSNALTADPALPPAARFGSGDLELLAREALTRPGAPALLASLCAAAPRRLSGSSGAEAAVLWAESTMHALGLENVRREPCLVPHWERGSVARLSLLPGESDPSGEVTELSILALGGSPPTAPGGLEAEVLMVNSLDELRGLGERTRGKAIFFARPMDPAAPNPFAAYGGAVDQRSVGPLVASEVGAAFAIVRSMTLAVDDHPHTGSMRYVEGVSVPAVAVSTLGAERLARRLASGAVVRARLELDCRWLPDVPSANVVGELVGRERPEEIVVLGGHLDAWDVGEGAHDDGAGCVHALEAVRLIRTLGWRPRRTLRVVLWMNEENGLRGALAYRDAHRAEMDRHVLALESDRGGFAPRGFDCCVSDEALRALSSMAEGLEPYGIGFVRASANAGADLGPLQELGVPTVGFVPDAARYFDLHHSMADTLSTVHPRELELGALCVAALCFAVADAERPLARLPRPVDPLHEH